MTNPWVLLARLTPEQIEALFEAVFTKYEQSFKPVGIKDNVVEVELADGRKVKETI